MEERLLLLIQQIILDLEQELLSLDLTQSEIELILFERVAVLMERFNAEVEEIIPPLIVQSYFGGVQAATASLSAAGVPVAAIPAIGAGGIIANEFRTPKHLSAVSELMDLSLGQFKAAINSTQGSFHKTIDKILPAVRDEIIKGTIVGDPRKVMQVKVMEAFKKDGLVAFTTSDNKQLPLDFYAMTVTRTVTRQAATDGSVNRYEEAGQDLVEIIENSDTCEVCGRYKGMVVSLRGETEGYPRVGDNDVRLPPYHPNCRGNIRPYVARFKTTEELENAKKRNEAYKPGEDTRTPAQKRAYAEEQKKRRIANDEKKEFLKLQRLFDGEEDMPKTLRAFRTMKHSNSDKYKRLTDRYARLANPQRYQNE